MAEVEITQEEVSGIDVNQVASMQLKDGTVVVVQGEGETGYDYQNEGEFTQEQAGQEEYNEYYQIDESNQLRARPMMVLAPPKPMGPRPMPVRPMGVPMGRPPVHPRGPPRVVPGAVVFRAKPRMPGPAPYVGPKPGMPVVRPGVPVRPVVPVRPAVVRPGPPLKPMVVPARPGVPHQKPLVNQMIQAPGVVFRARPGEKEEDYDWYDWQEEEYAEDENYGYDEQGQDEDYQLRAKPIFAPMGPPRPAPVMKPKVISVPVVAPRPVVAPKPVMVPGPKRGPLPVGHHTFQPKVFRARPVILRPGPPMATHHPLPPAMFPPRGVRPPVHVPKKHAYGFGPVLRSRPRSASYDQQEYADENEYQYTEGCESSVCTKCGKEF